MLVVAVDGVAPGIGKSTLASGLVTWLTQRGHVVDHFREEEILSRPAFGAVATSFRATGQAEPRQLITATGALIEDIRGSDVAVLDSLLPFIPSLLAWGHDRQTISTFIGDLTRLLGDVRLVTVYLDGSVESALERAIRREGQPWLSWLICRYAGTAEPVTDRDSLTAHMKRRRRLTLSVLAEHGWDLVVVKDADARSTADSLSVVCEALLERGLGGSV